MRANRQLGPLTPCPSPPQRGRGEYVRVAIAACLLTILPTSASAQAPTDPPKNVFESLPEKPPAWVAGYQLRYTLHCFGNMANSKSQSIVSRLPTGTWLRPDGADIAVQAADGTMLPVTVLSHATTGETLIQFPRHNNDAWYWAYAMNLQAPAAAGKPFQEGLLLEVTDWNGDLSSWTAVREGLTKSGPVLGNAFVGEIMQKANPARPDVPKHYAVTYRGYLNIKQDGVYRFFVNSEDASYLFIDGFKVCDRSGANPRVTGNIPTKSIGNDVELKAGIHPIEVYHANNENPLSYGGCFLLWAPPGAKTWVVCPREMFAQPDYAHVADIEAHGTSAAAVIDYGIDDVLLTAGGAAVHLVKFEAQGDIGDEKALVWDFGDGTRGTGRSVHHVYFAPGDYQVSLACGGPLPAYQRRVNVWAAPGAISPFSVDLIIKTLHSSDWKKLPGARLDQIVDFLQTSDHPAKWPFLAEIAVERLKSSDVDPQLRAQLYKLQIEAIGHSGKPAEMEPPLKLARTEFAKLQSLLVGVELAEANAWFRQFKDEDEAEKRFEAILEKYRRIEHPDMRWVAIGYGDLLTEKGEIKKAADMYRTAATLGGDAFLATAHSDAVTRGALLRVAEQKLRTGNIYETRQLLSKIELQYPDQKLEGMYRFLKAESDRYAGRYEDALRNYEVLMQLQQWAGYRDRAMYGIADCYIRMDDVDKALEWLGKIDKAFPAFYEKQGLAGQRLVLIARQEHIKAQKAGGGGKSPPKFQDFVTAFEPDENQFIGAHKATSAQIKFHPGLGFPGRHVALFEEYPAYAGYISYDRPLPNLTPNGRYWVECWVREDCFVLQPGFNAHIYLYVYGPGTQLHATRGQGTYFLERSIGSWRKVGFVLEAPTVNEGRVTLSMLAIGAMQIDGLSVRAVNDRQLDALSNFIDRTAEGSAQ